MSNIPEKIYVNDFNSHVMLACPARYSENDIEYTRSDQYDKMRSLLEEISEHLKEESFDATAVWLSDRYQEWEKEVKDLLNSESQGD